jgi:hypothetical protein
VGGNGASYQLLVTFGPDGQTTLGVELLKPREGERLDRARCQPGDLVLTDRGLSYAKDFVWVHTQGAYQLGRIHPHNTPLLARCGVALDLHRVVARADRGRHETAVAVCYEGTQIPARLAVRPLPPEAAARARQRLRASARKAGRTPCRKSLRWAGYVWLLTTLPRDIAATAALFRWYRVRWQVELYFKACKSLLGLRRLKKSGEPLTEVQILGKLLVVLLLERLRGTPRGESAWQQVMVYRMELVVAVYGGVAIRRAEEEAERLSPRPRRRRHSETVIAECRAALEKLPIPSGSWL